MASTGTTGNNQMSSNICHWKIFIHIVEFVNVVVSDIEIALENAKWAM